LKARQAARHTFAAAKNPPRGFHRCAQLAVESASLTIRRKLESVATRVPPYKAKGMRGKSHDFDA